MRYLIILLILVVVPLGITPIIYAIDLDKFRVQANQGDVNAQYNLGLMYEKGLVVSQDYHKAFEWYSKAAEQGHADAQNNLAYMFYAGLGVSKDCSKAIQWNREAADQGHARAQHRLGIMYANG